MKTAYPFQRDIIRKLLDQGRLDVVASLRLAWGDGEVFQPPSNLSDEVCAEIKQVNAVMIRTAAAIE